MKIIFKNKNQLKNKTKIKSHKKHEEKNITEQYEKQGTNHMISFLRKKKKSKEKIVKTKQNQKITQKKMSAHIIIFE